MFGETPTGVDLLTAVGEVGVFTTLLRAATGEVFGRAGHTRARQRVALQPQQVSDSQLGRQRRVLTEGSGLASPPRLGGQVDRRMQRRPDAHGEILLPGDVGETPHQAGVSQCGEPEWLGPLRERLGRERHAGVLDERVSRVGRDRHGDAVRRRLGQRLQVVLPARRRSRVVERVNVEVRQVLSGDDVSRARLADGARRLEQRTVGPGLDDRVEHEPDLLRQRQPSEQVTDPGVDIEPRILVGVHGPVAVEVAKLDPVVSGAPRRPHSSGPSSSAWVSSLVGVVSPWSGLVSPEQPGSGETRPELFDADDRPQGPFHGPGAERTAHHVVTQHVTQGAHDHRLVEREVASGDRA